jgi:deoxyribonucleoside regulator
MSTKGTEMSNSEAPTDDLSHPALLSNVAVLYYKEGLTQSEISKRIGVSRASVVNYLRQARDTGIVDIRIEGSAFASTGLSRKLCQKFGLEDAYIAPSSSDQAADQANQTRLVAQVSGMAMFDLLQPRDWLGVSWGGTVQLTANSFPNRPVPGLSVCQILGSMSSPDLASAEDCTIQIARKTGARCYTLHAPALLSDEALAEKLRQEPVIRQQLERFRNLTKILFSIGSIDDDTLMVTSEMATRSELADFKKRGAVGILCGRYISADGQQVDLDLNKRLIGIELEELRKVKTRMFVANGNRKLDAVLAVLHGGYATHLVIDEASGRELLSLQNS